MPLIATDDDVLRQIESNDAQVASLNAQIKALAPKMPALTLASWNADALAWGVWEAAAKQRLGGGLVFGEWFGVVADGNTVIAWKLKFDGYQQILNLIGAGATPATLVPPSPSAAQVADANNAGIVKAGTGAISDAASGVEGVVKWAAIGLIALGVSLVVARK